MSEWLRSHGYTVPKKPANADKPRRGRPPVAKATVSAKHTDPFNAEKMAKRRETEAIENVIRHFEQKRRRERYTRATMTEEDTWMSRSVAPYDPR